MVRTTFFSSPNWLQRLRTISHWPRIQNSKNNETQKRSNPFGSFSREMRSGVDLFTQLINNYDVHMRNSLVRSLIYDVIIISRIFFNIWMVCRRDRREPVCCQSFAGSRPAVLTKHVLTWSFTIVRNRFSILNSYRFCDRIEHIPMPNGPNGTVKIVSQVLSRRQLLSLFRGLFVLGSMHTAWIGSIADFHWDKIGVDLVPPKRMSYSYMKNDCLCNFRKTTQI